MKTVRCLLAAAALIAGCTAPIITPYTGQPVTTIIGSPDDYGQYPTNYEEVVHSYIQSWFKDPDSVKNLNIYPPKPTLWDDHRGTKTYCYFLMFEANAKNSYGGYSGIQGTGLYIRDGKFVYHP